LRSLDAPSTIDELYRDRGAVEITVPLAQGDVFDRIEVPSLGTGPRTVQVVMHPCSLRQGATLRKLITVAPVRKVGGAANEGTWGTKYFNHMLLPGLRDDTVFYVADFREVAPVKSEQLVLNSRIAALSGGGTALLQQRMIFALTRLVVERTQLAVAAAPVLTELELQESWCEIAVEASPSVDPDKALSESITDFHAWLDQDSKAHRRLLQDVSRHAQLRRDTMREARIRYANRKQ